VAVTNVRVFPVLQISRTCAKCGQGFNASAKEYLCSYCKKPIQNRPRILSQELTSRERQVVNLVKQAKANKEIANDLRLSQGTIKEYLFKIFKKLGVKNRTELALWAARNLAA
jgi:DNA-binding NarL/FixJ family response regulator